MTSPELDVLKSDPRVLQIYGSYTKLKGIGSGKFQGVCPLPGHSEKTGSFTCFSDGRWTCYGACAESGNIFQFLQKVDGCDFNTAVEKVKQVVGTKSEWDRNKERVETVFKPVAESKVFKTLSLSDYRKLEDNLANSKPAQDWLLKERGITYETARKLRLGFVQSIGRMAGAEGTDIADKGWLAFPCIEGDKVVSIKYRSVSRKAFARQPGMATALFNTQTISPFDPVMLSEGEFDCLALEQSGFKAVSLPSASVKLTPQQKDMLIQAQYIILAGDSDSAGATAMDRLWRELPNAYKLVWPEKVKDANECLMKHCGGDREKFVRLMDELVTKARSQPMPSVYSIREVMLSGDRAEQADHPDRLRFPWPSGDRMAVILPGDVVGIGSTSTGMGKTLGEVQLTLYNAMKYGKTVINWQTEMKPSEIAVMAAAQILRRDRNFLKPEDMAEAAKRLEGVNYYVGADPMLSDMNAVLDLIESAIKRLSADVVVLDHFHHLSTGMNNETQVQQVAMTRIVQIAKTYGVIFVNVGQPRKATQQTKTKQIHISDFKGSGAWGDAANAVFVLHRELNKEEGAKGVYEDKTLLKLLKARAMGTGPSSCFLTCFGEFASFDEIESHSEEPA